MNMANEEGGGRSGMNLLHHLRELIRQGNAEAFAQELNLDPDLTRTWFEQGFTQQGYGAEVARAIGTTVLDRMLLLATRKRGHTAG
jgi:hypothetical protein